MSEYDLGLNNITQRNAPLMRLFGHLFGNMAATFTTPLGRAGAYQVANNINTDTYNRLTNNILNSFNSGKNVGNTLSSIGRSFGSTMSGLGSVAGGGATNTAGDVLGGLSSMASAIPGPAGAIAGAALGAASFIANGFTDTVNEEFKAKKGLEIANIASQVSNAGDYESLLSDMGSIITSMNLGDLDQWGNKGIFISELGSERYKAKQEAKNAFGVATDTVLNNITNTANNINGTNTYNLLSNYKGAYGGKLNMNNVFDFGGNIPGNGSNFSTGMIHVNAGDTHEANPYEGVPMGADKNGTPNLVEENETVYNDYVYSNRLTVPVLKFNSKDKLTLEQKILRKYKGLTYADAAKKAEKLSGANERNDTITRQGFEYELQILANSQEKEREIQEHKEAEQELRNMSDEEFVARKQQQEEAQALQEQLMLQLNAQQEQLAAMLQLAGIDPQLFAQMSPELQQLIIAQILQQTQLLSNPEKAQAMQQLLSVQQPQMAYGGVFANGGKMSPEELQTAQAQEQLQLQEQQQLIQRQALSDLVNLLNLTTELPLTEEAPKLELTGIDSNTPANEMSTSELNETIDLIYLYAKTNGIKELAKRARKAKRASRESKEDFVDEALEDIDEYELQKSTQQQELELLNKLTQQTTSQELLAQELAQQVALLLNSEEQASAELNAQMLSSQQYANGGLMSEEKLKAMQQMAAYYSLYLLKTNPKAFEALNTEFALYAQLNQVSEEELPMLQIQYLASRALEDLQFMQMLKLLNSQYALGGSMNLNNANGGNTTNNGNKVFAGIELLDSDGNRYTDKELEKATRILRRLYKLKGINPNAFTRNYLQETLKKDLKTILDNIRNDSGYKAADDESLSIHSYNKKTRKQNLNDYLTQLETAFLDDPANKAIKLKVDENGNVEWDANKRFKAIDTNANGFNWFTAGNAKWDAHKMKFVGNRYYYIDADGNKHYIEKPDKNIFGNSISIGKGTTTMDGDDEYTDYEVKGNLNRTIYEARNGNLYEVSDVTGLDGQLVDTKGTLKDELIDDGVSRTTNWVREKPEDNDITQTSTLELPSKWPWYMGLGMLTGAFLGNLLTSPDYTHADALESAVAANTPFLSIGFTPIANYAKYTPFDFNWVNNLILSEAGANRRALLNSNNGNIGALMAGLNSASYNTQSAIGKSIREGSLYNQDNYMKVLAHNTDIDKYNSEGSLKRNIAQAELNAGNNKIKAEAAMKAATMRQAVDDAKSAALSANLSGMVNSVFDLYKLGITNKLVEYAINNGLPLFEALGGKLRTRRNRGLSF